jgi:hypothetical protein
MIEMRLVHHHRAIAPLPHMPGPFVARVEARRIAPVRIGHALPQPVRIGRDDQQMHMVRHQAPSPDLSLRLLRRHAQLIEIKAVIIIGKKHLLAPVAALGDVMGKAGNDDAGETGHERMMALNSVTVTVIVNSVTVTVIVTVIQF